MSWTVSARSQSRRTARSTSRPRTASAASSATPARTRTIDAEPAAPATFAEKKTLCELWRGLRVLRSANRCLLLRREPLQHRRRERRIDVDRGDHAERSDPGRVVEPRNLAPGALAAAIGVARTERSGEPICHAAVIDYYRIP